MLREFSAGGIVYKKTKNESDELSSRDRVEGEQTDEVLWLVRRPKGGNDYRGSLGWSFPKGWIDKGETLEQAALREVAEEGGVKAKIIVKLPTLKIFFTNPDGEKVMKFITYFVMEWQEDLKEGFGGETEEIKWAKTEEASGLLIYKNERELLEQAAKKVNP